MGQNLYKVENLYDTIAKEWAKTFSGEHEKKPKDQEILYRFSQEIGDRRPVWDFGCGPGNTTKYLKNLYYSRVENSFSHTTLVRRQST